MKWLAVDGDADGDGFVEYERRSRAGLLNQGWRDAGDAVVHADGTRAKGPVALAEVQGYVYYAKRRLAAIYGQLGDVERAERMAQEARDLKQRFNERFWMEDEQFFAMALDGEKRQVKTVCSTIGHCLWSRIVADEHVDAVARRLMAPDMFTGWGVRTVSKASVAYNPMSFYNGGVWPFDTAIAANGLKKHGYAQESNRLAYGLFETALAYESSRLPELFCGFNRQSSPRPVSFPMACRPARRRERGALPRAAVDARHLRAGRRERRLRSQSGAAEVDRRARPAQSDHRPYGDGPRLPAQRHADRVLGARQEGAGADSRRRVRAKGET